MKTSVQLTIIATSLLPLFGSCAKKKEYFPVPVADMRQDPVLRSPQGKVLDPADIESYPVARYVDPKNPNLMHEKHFVYRTAAPKFKLNSSPYERVYLGETAGVRSGYTVDETAEFKVTTSTQKEEMNQIRTQVSDLAENQRILATHQATMINALNEVLDTNKDEKGQGQDDSSYTPKSSEEQ